MFVFFHPCCKSEQASSEPPALEPSENDSRTPSEMKDNTKYDDESRDDGSRVQTTSGPSIKESLLSIKFLSICIYATIAQTRMNSIPGWTYSWLQERYFQKLNDMISLNSGVINRQNINRNFFSASDLFISIANDSVNLFT